MSSFGPDTAPSPLPEDALFRKLEAGEATVDEIFPQLFDLYYPVLYKLAAESGLSEPAAMDLIARIFVRGHDYLRAHTATNTFRSWLFTAFSVDIHRHRAGTPEKPELADARAVESAFERFRAAAANDQVVTTERRILLAEAMSTLSLDERRLIFLRFGEGKSIREIAEELGVTFSTAAARLFRLMAKLRARLGEETNVS